MPIHRDATVHPWTPIYPWMVRALLERHGITQRGLARAVGVNERTARRWVDDREGPLKPPTSTLFRVLITYPDVARWLFGLRRASEES